MNMSLQSTNKVSATDAGVRDPFQDLARLFLSPDTVGAYHHWPSWYDLVWHIEQEEYTGWDVPGHIHSLEQSPRHGPSKLLVLLYPRKAANINPVTHETAKEGDILSIQAAERYNKTAEKAADDLLCVLSGSPPSSDESSSHSDQEQSADTQSSKELSGCGYHNGVESPFGQPNEPVQWHLFNIKDLLMIVKRMTQVAELGFNTYADPNTRRSELAISNASTLRRLRQVFAERSNAQEFDGCLRHILWLDIAENINFFDNKCSTRTRHIFLDQYLKWLDNWRKVLEHWERILEERRHDPLRGADNGRYYDGRVQPFVRSWKSALSVSLCT